MNLEKDGLIIIGNGIAGITAARKVRQLHPRLRIRIISAESKYFFSRTALMYIYMGHMSLQDTQPYETRFYPENRLELLLGHVKAIHPEKKELELTGDTPLHYDLLLLTTGSRYNKFGWPGQDLPGVQGLYSLQDLESLEQNTTQHKVQSAVIAGGGLIGIELAEMLHTRGIKVNFLVREQSYWSSILPPEESSMINDEIRAHHITLHLGTELQEILAGKDGRVGSVLTNKGEKIPCQLAGLTAGVSPEISLVKESPHGTGLESARGILVDSCMRTNAADIFAAGDCAQLRQADHSPGAVEQLWYTGRMQGSVAGRFIARRAYEIEGEKERAAGIPKQAYDRGIHFNSAKFFTIEYQTYGQVPAKLRPEQTFLWQDRSKKKLIRLVWEKDNPQSPITGMNFLGTRYRQDLCTQWIKEQKSARRAAQHLEQACFDPEFYEASYRPFQKAFQENSDSSYFKKNSDPTLFLSSYPELSHSS